jgi:hypothetical protein
MRDILLAFSILQAIIICLSLFISVCDYKTHLPEVMHMEDSSRLCYYLFGLTAFLAIVGMIMAFATFSGLLDTRSIPNTPCYCCDCIFIPSDSAGCCACDCGRHTCVGCGNCLEIGSGTTLGEECIACVFIVIIIFAVIGIFVCIFLGAYYVNLLVQQHIHVLKKWDLSKEYVVVDLADDAIPLESTNESLKDSFLFGCCSRRKLDSAKKPVYSSVMDDNDIEESLEMTRQRQNDGRDDLDNSDGRAFATSLSSSSPIASMNMSRRIHNDQFPPSAPFLAAERERELRQLGLL